MRYLSLVISAVIFLVSCKKATPDLSLQGAYQGTFQRQIGITGAISDVTLIFSPGDFIGQSTQPKYPAICNGTYSLRGNKIEFMNACFWTADFDGRLILNGEFDFQQKGDSLFISRSYPGVILTVDVYKLKKQ